MNEPIDDIDVASLLKEPRLTRSSSESRIFCKLDDRNKVEITSGSNQRGLCLTLDEANKNFETIVNDKERAEAYRDLCRTLDGIIQAEKRDNLKNIKENSSFIKEQYNQIEKLETELRTAKEQLLNSKELINQTSEENIELKNSIESLEQKSAELNQKIIDLSKEIDIEEIVRKVLLFVGNQEEKENQNLDETVNDIVTNLGTTFSEAKKILKSKMQVEAKDVIAGIPSFSGDPKQFDGFLNSCELYYSIVENDDKPKVLKIIKAKIHGDALFKAGPFGDEINTWDLMKKRLKEKIKKPVTLEYAQEDLNQVFQKKGESIEDFGARVKTKLKKLNEASKLLSEDVNEHKILQKMNEKQAINKFEQNIRDSTIKVLVSAANKPTLDECITFAMQKELTEKSKNVKFDVKSCTICGLTNHDESTCRKKNNSKTDNNFNRNKKYSGNGGNNQQNKNFNKNSQNYERKQPSNTFKNDQKPSTSGNFSSNSKNRNFSQYSKNNSNNEKSNENQKNVKTVNEDEYMDLKTVKEVLEESQNSKN